MEKLEQKLYNLAHYLSQKGHFKFYKITYYFADFVSAINCYSLKYALLELVWLILKNLNKGESYSYETAPYCGHHYSGFQNKYIILELYEGEGCGKTKFSFLGYRLYYNNIDTNEYYVAKDYKL